MTIEPRDLELIHTVLNEYNAFFESYPTEKAIVQSILDKLQEFVDKSDIDYEILRNVAIYFAGYFREDPTDIQDWDWTSEGLANISDLLMNNILEE